MSAPDADKSTASSEAGCPVCGSRGMTACVGLGGKDHAERRPYFDERATAALESMNRSARQEAAIERRDRYTIVVEGHSVRATEDQEQRIRAMDAEERARFLTIMGHGGDQ